MTKTYQKQLVGVFGDPVDDNPSVVVEHGRNRCDGVLL